MAEAQVSRAVPSEDEELSDGQIQELLKRAEVRLRAQAQALTAGSSPADYLPRPSKLELEPHMRPYVNAAGDLAHADGSRLLESSSRTAANAARKIEDPVVIQQNKLKAKKATAGPDWYNLPRTNLTPELKRDLQLIQMRSVLDPKRFYKKQNAKAKPPEFAEVGTIIEGPFDFYSSRVPKKERKRTLAEGILAEESEGGKLRRQYLDIQTAKTSGKKAHYKALMAKRYGKKMKR